MSAEEAAAFRRPHKFALLADDVTTRIGYALEAVRRASALDDDTASASPAALRPLETQARSAGKAFIQRGWKKTVAVAICLLMLAPLMAVADDGVFRGEGGTVILSHADDLCMVEEVVLDLADPEVVHAMCLFVVTNDGPADSLLLGFPDSSPAREGDQGAIASPEAIYDLAVTVDGEAVTIRTVAVKVLEGAGFGGPGLRIPYDRAQVWRCFFAPGQTRILRTEYRHRTSTHVGARYMVHYILTTGGVLDRVPRAGDCEGAAGPVAPEAGVEPARLDVDRRGVRLDGRGIGADRRCRDRAGVAGRLRECAGRRLASANHFRLG